MPPAHGLAWLASSRGPAADRPSRRPDGALVRLLTALGLKFLHSKAARTLPTAPWVLRKVTAP